jgi:periplasmic protein TonB
VHVILVDDRQPGAKSPGRILPAFSASMISHVALLLCLAVVFHETRQRESTDSAADLSAPTQLVWVSSGDGGGGGGGNENQEPSRRLQRSGTDRVTTPAVRASLVEFRESAPEPEQAIVVPTLPLAAESLTLPGAMNNPSFSIDSLGPGTGGGTETGSGSGTGPGNGPGSRLGDGGNVGGGPNKGGAKLVMPTVIRDVKPEYTAEAMRAHVQGAVLVRAIVQADGTVRDAQVVRSLDPVFGLDQAAVRAAAHWRFRPALIAGQPVPMAITIELVFSLR